MGSPRANSSFWYLSLGLWGSYQPHSFSQSSFPSSRILMMVGGQKHQKCYCNTTTSKKVDFKSPHKNTKKGSSLATGFKSIYAILMRESSTIFPATSFLSHLLFNDSTDFVQSIHFDRSQDRSCHSLLKYHIYISTLLGFYFIMP